MSDDADLVCFFCGDTALTVGREFGVVEIWTCLRCADEFKALVGEFRGAPWRSDAVAFALSQGEEYELGGYRPWTARFEQDLRELVDWGTND